MTASYPVFKRRLYRICRTAMSICSASTARLKESPLQTLFGLEFQFFRTVLSWKNARAGNERRKNTNPSKDPLADHNRVRERQGAPRQISLSKLFANSIATFAFISARSAHIRRYFWN